VGVASSPTTTTLREKERVVVGRRGGGLTCSEACHVACCATWHSTPMHQSQPPPLHSPITCIMVWGAFLALWGKPQVCVGWWKALYGRVVPYKQPTRPYKPWAHALQGPHTCTNHGCLPHHHLSSPPHPFMCSMSRPPSPLTPLDACKATLGRAKACTSGHVGQPLALIRV
jgi:hypothetical protein